MVYKDRSTAAERTLRLLESVVASQTGLTAAQLSRMLHIPRSAIYTLLNTLIHLGYIAQDGPRKPYKPGPRLWYLNQPYPTGTNALITAFRAETGRSLPEETFALAILNENDAVIIAETPAKHRVRCVIPVGKRENAVTHPAGLILLAGLSRMALTQILIPFTGELANKLTNVRSITPVSAKQDDVITLAAPICPDGHHPEAALILCCPIFRWSSQRAQYFSTMVHETAARISHRLGAIIYRPYEGTAVHPPGESTQMSQHALQAFLKGPWAARLACIRPDGTPHVVPVWYEWQDGSFVIVAWPNSVWASFLIANPTVALSIDEPWPPMRRVMIRGEASLLPHHDIPGGIDNLRHRISTRYLGAAHGLSTESLLDSTAWSAFRIKPHQCIALREKQPEG